MDALGHVPIAKVNTRFGVGAGKPAWIEGVSQKPGKCQRILYRPESGHPGNCSRKDLHWMLGKYFSNRVIDNCNMLPVPDSCVNCSTINTFKKRLSSELEWEAVKLKVCQL